MNTLKNIEVAVNGTTYNVEVEEWTLPGFTANDGKTVYPETTGTKVLKVNGEIGLDFFMKNQEAYFEICKYFDK